MKLYLAAIFLFAGSASSASAGFVENWVVTHGNCRGGGNSYNTLDAMLETHISSGDEFLGRPASEWTDADLQEFKQKLTECIRLHPAAVMSVFRAGEPIIAPPGAIDRHVEARMNELMRVLIEPARSAKRDDEAATAARQEMQLERDRAHAEAESEQERQREAEAIAKRSREIARDRENRAAIQKQAQRDRDAATQAKVLAEQEAPLIAATEKEAGEARSERLAAEKALEDVRRRVATSQSQRATEDAAIASAKAKRLQLEQADAQRKRDQREDEALAKSCSVTADQFGRIAIGMNLREVRRTFACVGSLTSSTEIQGLGAFSVYQWNGVTAGAAAVTTFNQDKVVAKSQNALD